MAPSTVDGIELRNSVALSNDHLTLLWNDWSRLSSVASNLAEPVLRFIVDGEEAGILNRLTATTGCGTALGLYGCIDWQTKGAGDRKARVAFFKQPPAVNAAFYHRLAQAYDAAAPIANQTAGSSRICLPGST